MASAAVKFDSSIPKFDGSNFQLWKFSITILLKAENLLSIVNGTEKMPADQSSEEWKVWDLKNSKAQVLLLSTITQQQMQFLINCEDAAQMWGRLISIHEQKTEISKELLWQRFYEYRMPENASVAEHISSIELLVRQLKDVKEHISVSAICSKVINSLPSKFNAFRTAWDSVSSDQQTFENLTARLLKEETRMTNDDSEMSRLALEVRALQSQLENTNLKKGKTNIQDLKKTTTCNYCKKKGHWVRECRKRMYDAKKNQNNHDRNDSPPSSSAYICDISSLYSASHDLEKDEWICDSGASMHMSGHKEWFKNLKPIENPMFVRIANDKLIEATGTGSIEIKVFVEGQWHDRIINNVLYLPNISRSLFSVGVMTDKGFTHHSYKDRCEFRDSDGNISCTGVRKNNLWIMKFKVVPPLECNLSLASKNSLRLWHDRLGHVNFKAILNTTKLVKDLNINDKEDFFCEVCQLGKQSRKSHKKLESRRSEKPGEMIHSDVCGPMNISSPSGSRYFVLFKDDCSGYRTVYFLKAKSEVYTKFVQYQAYVERQTGNKIKILRSDQGKGEYLNKEFQDYLKKEGISHEWSAPYTPQQNGRSERELRTIVESARSMLINKHVPQELWSEAVNTAAYLLNRTASSQVQKMTPYEKWFGRKPELKHIRIFGSPAYMAIPPQFRKKWDPKSRKLLFVGYEGYSSNYRLWDAAKRRIEVSCNVTFNENEAMDFEEEVFTLKFGNFERTTTDEQTEVEEIIEEETDNIETPSETVTESLNSDDDSYLDAEDPYDFGNNELLNENNFEERQLRDRTKISIPSKFSDFYMDFPEANYSSIYEPGSYDDAVSCADSRKWHIAMEEEMDSLKENNTWDLVKLPPNSKVVDNKWVFRVKTDENGSVQRFKARLVARGFTQEKGVDFEETFAPVVRYDSIRVLLALAAEKDLQVSNFDVQTAFLYGDLKECVYMRQPTGFVSKKHPNLVCKLNRSLYGLKQSPRCWNQKFVSFLEKYKFKQLKSDQCVFVGSFGNSVIYLAIYVDDGLILSQSKIAIKELIDTLKCMFKITVNLDNNKLHFVGLEIEQNLAAGKVLVHQQSYITKLLTKYNMTDAKPVTVPADVSEPLSSPKDNSSCNKDQPYREVVGSLIFLATSSRPDISYAVNQVSRFFNNWTDQHWKAVKRILRYLKHTLHYKLVYAKSTKIDVIGYTDADYAGCIDTRKSTSGYVFIIADGPVTWKSQKQNVVAQSTTEAEYIALALGTREALWLKSFLKELDIEIPSIRINVDNQSAIKLAHAHQFHSRTKHIDVKVHFVRDECEKGNIIVSYVNSSEQLADLFTKALTKTVLSNLIEKLNLS